MVKMQVNERMYQMVRQAMKKLRSVNDDGEFRRKSYVLNSLGSDAIKT